MPRGAESEYREAIRSAILMLSPEEMRQFLRF